MSQLVKFVRNRKRQPQGVVVAVGVGKRKFRLGYSLCNRKDAFNKEHGVSLAVGRAFLSPVQTPKAKYVVPENVPHTLRKPLEEMQERATRYFKAA